MDQVDALQVDLQELINNPAVEAMARRVHPVLLVARGHHDTPELPDLTRRIALLITALNRHPDKGAVFGDGMAVTKAVGMLGWSVHVTAASESNFNINMHELSRKEATL